MTQKPHLPSPFEEGREFETIQGKDSLPWLALHEEATAASVLGQRLGGDNYPYEELDKTRQDKTTAWRKHAFC